MTKLEEDSINRGKCDEHLSFSRWCLNWWSGFWMAHPKILSFFYFVSCAVKFAFQALFNAFVFGSMIFFGLLMFMPSFREVLLESNIEMAQKGALLIGFFIFIGMKIIIVLGRFTTIMQNKYFK